jgi:hypothetical protein
MPEKIYTIPINESFDLHNRISDAHVEGCPFCFLHEKLEDTTLSYCLGAAMMEPDVRIEMNDKGFCNRHLSSLAAIKNKLGLALILESHLEQIKALFKTPPTADKKGLFAARPLGSDGGNLLEKLSQSCFVCDKIRFTESRYCSNTVALWNIDEGFRQKFNNQPFFCISHAASLLLSAKKELSPDRYARFYQAVMLLEENYITALKEITEKFTVSFDHRNAGKPLGDEKHCIEKSVAFLK